ncbi:uncharacterized protein LOC132883021 isoform X1 [Neoarius graeffei]|uniref:uncharacterized protein LOC132883021 isoform X1 n=1 Tax=Neoarius graeffei TaxID=443677 RepID=UPI00298CCB1F|nr:uncharacterized protein LOC132883021 isoform X1 [Neoarius graeffei]XP_060772127.1 uncharacterized protein LOC132883021 isoform X1 [Neoarius graeffei]
MITLLAIFGLFITVKTSDIIELQVQTVRRGDNVTIKCDENLLKDNQDNLVWYKQSFGKVPQHVARKFKNTYRFNPKFDDGHLDITQEGKRFDINIVRTKEEDSATYFCTEMLDNVVKFESGTLLAFQAEKANHPVPTLTVISSGESVTLQCSVQVIASSCAGEQGVYLFKHGSGESHTGLIYTPGDSSAQCKRSSKDGFPTQSCSYTLLKSSIGYADAGIYHCAVAACGRIFFGIGTKVDLKGNNSEKEGMCNNFILRIGLLVMLIIHMILHVVCKICTNITKTDVRSNKY